MGKYLSLQPGRGRDNTLSLLHGLYSERVRQPIELRFADALREAMRSGLDAAFSETLDEHAIRRAARALATVEIAEAIIDEEGHDALSDRAFRDYERACTQADRWLERLGMTPSARAKLGVDVARTFDLVAAMEQRRQARPACDGCGAVARYRNRSTGETLCERCAKERRQ